MGRLCTLSAVVTMDNYNCISDCNNEKIMEIPEFESKVRQQTLGCTIIMGRKTWEKTTPLNNRTYIVLSTNKDYKPKTSPYYKVFVANRFLELFYILNKTNVKTAYVYGGKSIYNRLNKFISNFIICKIRHRLHGNNRFINPLPNKKYMLVESKLYTHTTKTGADYRWSLEKYVKRTSSDKILPSVAHMFNKK